MSLESLLLPGESIRFRTGRNVQFGTSPFTGYVTNLRLILHAKRGLLGRDDMVGYKLTEIKNYKYHEEGFFAKKGVLTLDLDRTAGKITGPTVDVKQLYNFVIGASLATTPST